jgi:hypothetical protein
MFVTAHQSVEAMSRSMWQSLKRHNYVTPTNYLETVRNYKALLAEKRTELLAKSNKLKGGLTKLDETRVQVGLCILLWTIGMRLPGATCQELCRSHTVQPGSCTHTRTLCHCLRVLHVLLLSGVWSQHTSEVAGQSALSQLF